MGGRAARSGCASRLFGSERLAAARTSDADQKRRLRAARLEPTPFGVDLEPESLERLDAEQRIRARQEQSNRRACPAAHAHAHRARLESPTPVVQRDLESLRQCGSPYLAGERRRDD